MKHYTNTNNPVDFPGSDHHSGDGGYSLGTQEKYTEFVKGRNHSIGKARIRLLAEQAGMNIVDDKFSTYGKFAEKFAELIVRECAKALDDKLANPNGASMAYCDGSDLLEHFGVEE